MFRAMLWKEVREQGAILIALLVLGSGVIAAATVLGSSAGSEGGVADFRAYTNAGRLAVLSLAIAAGVVVGGTLFAGEKENGTLACLEALPANRWRIWWGKLGAGVAMAFVAGVVLLAMGTFVGALGSNAPLTWLMWGLVLVFVAFGWGAFGSTICETTLAACATGLVCAVVLGTPVFVVVVNLLRAAMGSDPSSFRGRPLHGLWLEAPPLIAMYSVAIVPLLMAGWAFTAPDRARHATVKARGLRAVVRRPERSGFLGSLKALLWLTNRQWFVASAVGCGLALLAGVSCLHEDLHLMLLWPSVTALVGVFAGVLAWADEQSKDTYKFWGERRLPLGRLWVMKVTTSFVLALGWTLAAFAPSLIRQLLMEREAPLLPAAFRSGLLGHEGWALLNYLFIWPAYGFAFGHVAGLLFRKTIVALGVGVLTAAPVAALWLPSLLTGGVHAWQLWPVPLVVLLTTRALLRPWSADRLARLKPLATVAVVGTACVLWTAFGLSYRFLEAPVVAEINDDLAFAETVPTLDNDDGGRVFRQTTAAFRTLFRDDYAGTLTRGGVPLTMRNALAALPRSQWADDDLKALGGLLDSPTLDFVVRQLKEGADKPLGPIDNPLGLVSYTAMFRDAGDLPLVVTALVARGLRKQQQGDDKDFVVCLDAALAATRNARTMQPGQIYLTAYAPERQIFDAVDEWLHRAAPRPEPIRGALAVLEKHERLCPRDLKQAFLADRMIQRLRLAGVSQWAPLQLEYEIARFSRSNPSESLKQKANVETELLNFSLAVPWERERYRRILGQNNAGVASPQLMNHWLGDHFMLDPMTARLSRPEQASQALLAVALTQIRLSLFELETGRQVATLDELVPRYCPAVPADPYDGKPLRYRRSEGESLRLGVKYDPLLGMGPPVTEEERAVLSAATGGSGFVELAAPIYFLREIEEGQGVVWSIGPDWVDQGGKIPIESSPYDFGRGDFVRVVPGKKGR